MTNDSSSVLSIKYNCSGFTQEIEDASPVLIEQTTVCFDLPPSSNDVYSDELKS